jgi:hypothetical protein
MTKKKKTVRKEAKSQNDLMHFEDLHRMEQAIDQACDQLKKDWKSRKRTKILESGNKLLLLMGECSFMMNEFNKLKARSR